MKNTRQIVHTEQLDTYNRLDVFWHDVSEDECYTFRVCYLDEQGEQFGSGSSGQWFDTRAAAIAGGILYHLLDN